MLETADCEQRDDWLLEQDVNAWSSLSYVAIGLVLLREAARHRLPRPAIGLAIALSAEGAGSWLYHGAAGDISQFLHDVPLVGALGFVAGWHAGRLRDASDLGSLVGLGFGTVLGGALFFWSPGATNAAVGLAVAITVGASLEARRRRLVGVWTLPLLVLAAVSLATWGLGTPNSPVCRAESWLQPHGLWHVLTAVLALAWADSAYAAANPDRAPRLLRRFADRTLGLLARGLVLAFHRSVEVRMRDRLPGGRPVLLVANHGNGFVDPVVVAGVLGRLPRFLAKAALWQVAPARPLLWLAGVLPVYRTADGDRASDNRSVFAACHRELAQRAVVAIFPEGTTGDRSALDRVKSGAARIALGALPAAPDLVIIPVGMAFENKVETRSRAVVVFGEPIVVADHAGSGLDHDGEPHRDDAAALTARITESLEVVSPQFASLDERSMLRAAAREERSDALSWAEPSFGDTEVVARRLAASPPDTRRQVIAAYRDFATRLQVLGITAGQLRPDRLSTGRLAWSALLLFLAGTALVAVTLIHLPALFIVVAGTGLVRSTATKGTVRLLLGLVALLMTWLIAGMWIGDGWAAVAAGVAVAVGGAIAFAVWSPIIRATAVLMGRVGLRDRAGLVTPVIEARSRLVATVRAGIEADDDDT